MKYLPKRKTVFTIGIALGLLGVVFFGARRWDHFVGNAPIRFYGRVVDENGSGIPGVQVAAQLTTVRWDSVPVAPRYNRRTMIAVTDNEGRFDFHFGRGKFLRVGPFKKEGWKPSEVGFRRVETTFEYPLLGYEYPPGARKKPDNPDDPIVYPMVRDVPPS
jgi:hypothetical protein